MLRTYLSVLLLLYIHANCWSQDVLNNYSEGLRYIKNNQPEKALTRFELILNADKESFWGLLGESYYYIYKKEWGLSLDILNRTLSKNQKNSDAYLNRAICKYHLGEYNASLEDINFSLDIDPGNLKSTLYKGFLMSKFGEYKQALILLNSVEKKLSPDIYSNEIISEFKEIWFHIGNCHLNLKDFSLALYAYNKAVKENPENSDIIYSRAAVHYNNKNWVEALKDYNKVIKLNRKNTNAFYYRGLCNRELYNYNEAIKDFDYIIKIAPKNGLFYHTRGVVYAEKGNHKNAINDYNMGLELNPNNADIFLRRGYSLQKIGSTGSAIKDFSRAISLSKEIKPYALSNRANSYRILKQYSEARNDIRVSLSLDSLNNWAYLYSGLINSDEGLLDQAIEDFNQSINLNPNIPESFYHRAELYIKKGMYDKALSDLQRTESIDANFRKKEVAELKKNALNQSKA